MKIISWNVNGLKSILKKNFYTNVNQLNADFICIQETKINSELKELKLESYYKYFNFSKKNGYAGVAIFTKEKPINVLSGMTLKNEFGENVNFDNESRVITLEYSDFYIVSVYVPSSQTGRSRFNYRLYFGTKFNEYIEKLNNTKNVIICGDFNICYKAIDVCEFQKHRKLDVFKDEERADFEELLNIGFIDTYRFMHPQMREYTFWINEYSREDKNNGWRLDYILVSEHLKKDIREANILENIEGSDHCPIELVIKL